MNRQARAVYLDELERPHPRTRADRVVVAGMWVAAGVVVGVCWLGVFWAFSWVGASIGRWLEGV